MWVQCPFPGPHYQKNQKKKKGWGLICLNTEKHKKVGL